jgi:hypothetical protein
MDENGACTICGRPYTRFGNNAEPINHGRCCDDCNRDIILPARISRIQQGRDPRQVETDIEPIDASHRRR